MVKKITLLRKSILLSFLFISLGFSTAAYAQCAGQDANLSTCNKEVNQFIDLFAALGGSPERGGTWIDVDNTGGLNATTGILNTWQISSGGTFSYTYTNATCSQSATVTLALAGFPGQSNMLAVACDDNTRVNLFQFTGGSPAATTPGNWMLIDVNNERGDNVASISNALTGRNFNALQAGTGTYTFRYTITDQPAIDCQSGSGSTSSLSSMVRLEVSPAPNAGNLDITTKTIFCETDDFSSLRNFDLRNAIVNEDEGGTWTESRTNEISNANDSFIDIQNIRDTYGVGIYSFTYTVEPINQICNESEITVDIVIEQVADFRNATLEFSFPEALDDVICEDTLPINPVVTITGDIVDIPNGDYVMTYSVGTAPNTGTEIITVTMTDGVGTFNANPSFFTGVGIAELAITSIQDPNTEGTCISYIGDLRDRLTIIGLPNLSDIALSVTQPLCLEEDGVFNLSDAGTTPELELIDGSYSFTYSLSSGGVATTYTQNADVVSGVAAITLASNALATADDYILTLLNVTNDAGCSTDTNVVTNFTVSPKPNAETIAITVTDACENDLVTVNISDSAATPNLIDGVYYFNYEISGAINATNQVANQVTITNGTGSFNLPATLLVNGDSSLTLMGIVNTMTTCEADNLTMPTSDFTITPITDASNAVLAFADICEDSTGSLLITAPAIEIQDGTYTVLYDLSGANASSQNQSTVTFTAGVGTLEIPAVQLENAGTNTITITSLSTNVLNCEATGLPLTQDFEILPTPDLESTTISATDICLGENGQILFSNSNLADGSYEVEYELTGANLYSNLETVQFVQGNATLSLDASFLMNDGNTIFTIEAITNPLSNCANTTLYTTSFTINPIPELATESINASDICLAENGLVSISNATGLSDGDYTITYDLSGSNSSSNLSASVTVTNGSGVFEIPATVLTQLGITTVTITAVTNSTSCAPGTLNISNDFEIFDLPDATGVTLTTNDVCFGEAVSIAIDNASSLADASYMVTYQLSGANTTQTSTAELTFVSGSANLILDSALLTNAGNTTFEILDIQNFTTLCSASNLSAAPVQFNLEDPEIPTISATGSIFCINDDPTMADLLANINSSFEVLVYDAPTNGNLISSTASLSANTTYYFAAQNTSTGCESSQRLAVTADLTGCDSVFIPEGFSPNGDGINDLFEMKNIDIIYPNYTIEIFNRNGSVVFKGNASMAPWNGQANQNRLGGNTLPNGTYFYIINYNNGQKSSKQGKVYLNR